MDTEKTDGNPKLDLSETVEKEVIDIEKISSPFDPEKIKIDQQNVNLGSLIEMLENNEIDLMPDFQRSIDLWDDTQKSRLVVVFKYEQANPQFPQYLGYHVHKNSNGIPNPIKIRLGIS